jgi:hypothetical protein
MNTKDRQRQRDLAAPQGRASNTWLAIVAVVITVAAIAAARALGR